MRWQPSTGTNRGPTVLPVVVWVPAGSSRSSSSPQDSSAGLKRARTASTRSTWSANASSSGPALEELRPVTDDDVAEPDVVRLVPGLDDQVAELLQQVDVGVEEREELLADDDVVAQRADQLVEDDVDGARALVQVVAPAEATSQAGRRLLALHDERRLELGGRFDHGRARPCCVRRRHPAPAPRRSPRFSRLSTSPSTRRSSAVRPSDTSSTVYTPKTTGVARYSSLRGEPSIISRTHERARASTRRTRRATSACPR